MRINEGPRLKTAFYLGLASSLLTLSACGGGQAKQSHSQPESPPAAQSAQQKQKQQNEAKNAQPPQNEPQLGEQNVQPSQTPVVETHQVTRTVSSEIPTVKITEYRGDLNKMDATNFEVLGVPPDVAQNIVQFRQGHGGQFSSVSELRQVPGVTDNLYSALESKVAVGQ